MVNPVFTKPVAQAVKLKAKINQGRLNKSDAFEKRLLALKNKDVVERNDTGESEESFEQQPIQDPGSVVKFESDVSVSEAKPLQASRAEAPEKLTSQSTEAKDPLAIALTNAPPVQPAAPVLERESVRATAFDQTTSHLIKQMDAVERLEFSKKSDWVFKQIGPNHVQATIRLSQLDNGAWAMQLNLPHLVGPARNNTAEALRQHLIRRGHRIDSLNMDVSDDADRES